MIVLKVKLEVEEERWNREVYMRYCVLIGNCGLMGIEEWLRWPANIHVEVNKVSCEYYLWSKNVDVKDEVETDFKSGGLRYTNQQRRPR